MEDYDKHDKNILNKNVSNKTIAEQPQYLHLINTLKIAVGRR